MPSAQDRKKPIEPPAKQEKCYQEYKTEAEPGAGPPGGRFSNRRVYRVRYKVNGLEREAKVGELDGSNVAGFGALVVAIWAKLDGASATYFSSMLSPTSGQLFINRIDPRQVVEAEDFET
ncbi:MAG: hypothetical protein K8T20_19420 [Planctomycetes bacterium]|nr:hypothetical protein [Planctomycetota bacterium]